MKLPFEKFSKLWHEYSMKLCCCSIIQGL